MIQMPEHGNRLYHIHSRRWGTVVRVPKAGYRHTHPIEPELLLALDDWGKRIVLEDAEFTKHSTCYITSNNLSSYLKQAPIKKTSYMKCLEKFHEFWNGIK